MRDAFHPDLPWHVRLLPRGVVGPRTFRWMRRLARLGAKPPRPGAGVDAEVVALPHGQTARVFRPARRAPQATLLWLHGGGFVVGTPQNEDGDAELFARELGIRVVAPTYRLAPEHPFPAQLDDAYATLRWIHASGERHVMVGGASAGGGLAAGVCLRARDEGDVPVRFQLLVYPMLDDRTVGRAIDGRHHRLWDARSNRFAWSSYLGAALGGVAVSPYAAPARAESLAGLPPTWIGVGELDLFHDEDVAFAARLRAAGVPVDVDVIPGVFHAFDRFRDAPVVAAFRASQVSALRRALARGDAGRA